jgi:hypothetical protein
MLLVSSVSVTFFITRNKTFGKAFELGEKTGTAQGYKKGEEAGYKRGWQEGLATDTGGCSKFKSGTLIPDCGTQETSQTQQGTTLTDTTVHCTTRTFGDYFSTTYTDCY